MATRQIDLIIIHCSATPNGRWTTVEDIDGWHRQRGFARLTAARQRYNPRLPAIGYHRVIYTNGAPATGRDLGEVGAHVSGWNAHSIGICMIGTDRYSPEQWATLAEQVRMLAGMYRIPLRVADVARDGRSARGICGHRDLSPDKDGNGLVEPYEWLKTCPGFSVRDWLAGGMTAPAEHVLQPESGK